MKPIIRSKYKPKPKSATVKPKSSFPEADKFMNSSVSEYLANHKGVVTFSDLIHSVVRELETAVKEDPAKFNLTAEQVQNFKGDK